MMARVPVLWAVFALQLFCAVFFVLDAVLDFLGYEGTTGIRALDTVEYFIAIALLIGVLITGREISRIMQRNNRLSDQVRAASGEFSTLMDDRFADWGLTASERDVAILSIKGLSVAEIAEARGSAEGTVKAHSAGVYRKAGVTGRLQLLSLFVDELVDAPMIDPKSR
ncbi:MAG: helix-turn-helix transcriptional regulator [Boseongicola sp.]